VPDLGKLREDAATASILAGRGIMDPSPRCAGYPLALAWIATSIAVGVTGGVLAKLAPPGETLDATLMAAGAVSVVYLVWAPVFIVAETIMALRDRAAGRWPYPPWTRWALLLGIVLPTLGNALDPVLTFPWLVPCGACMAPGTLLTGPFNLVQQVVIALVWPLLFRVWTAGAPFEGAALRTALVHLILFGAMVALSALPVAVYALYPAVVAGGMVESAGASGAVPARVATWGLFAAVGPFLVNLDAALPVLGWGLVWRRARRQPQG
jgi:hypothetical protein